MSKDGTKYSSLISLFVMNESLLDRISSTRARRRLDNSRRMHEDFVLLNVDMSSAFSVVASGGASAQHPKHTDD